MVRSRRSYTREFKVETVRLAYESEKSVSQIARELGIHPTLIGRWIKQLEVDPEVRRFLSLLRASARSKSGLGRRLPSSSREKMNLSLFCLVSGRQFFNVLILASNSALSSNSSREKMNLSLFCLVSGRQFFNVLILASNSALSSNASYRYNFLFLAMCPSFIFSRAGLCACLLKGRCGSAHRSHSSA